MLVILVVLAWLVALVVFVRFPAINPPGEGE
jgi:hypothetical protein